MARRILLLADDQRFAELRRLGGLPDHFYADAGPDVTEPPANSAAYFVRHDPALLAPLGPSPPGPSGDRQVQEALRDILFARLLGNVVCHLVVLDASPSSVSSLSDLLRWYESFHREADRRMEKRKPEYRHVLILVCAADLPEKDFADFQRLVAGSGEDKRLDACYVMFKTLELGEDDVLFARYVWPTWVGRLLLRLLGEDTPNEPQTITKAWRAFELVPDVDPRLVEDQCLEGLGIAYEKLARAVSRPGWDAGRFRPAYVTPEKVALPDRTIHRATHWEEFPASARLAETTDAVYWEGELTEAGRTFGAQLSRQAIGEVPAAWTEVETVWRHVHDDPSQVATALADRALMSGPSSEELFEEVSAQWADVQRREQERTRMVQDAGGCSEHLEEAQASLVERAFRVGFAAAVTVLISWLAVSVFQDLLNSWTIPLVVAACGALGGLAAALLPYLLERYRGEVAVGTFIRALQAIDQQTRDKHFACQSSVQKAHAFWQVLGAKGAARRLSLLLKRLRDMLEHEFQPQSVGAVPITAPGGPQWSGDDATQEDRLRRAQQARAREATLVPCSIGFHLGNVDRDRITQVASTQVDRFRDCLWRDYCRHDRRNAGCLPAHVLVPMLRDFRDDFRRRITAEVHRQAVDKVSTHGREELSRWVQGKQNETYPFYMSCKLPAGVSDDRFTRRLILRPSFRPEGLQVGSKVPVVGNTPSWQFLEQLPSVGYYFEEVAIACSVDRNGGVGVKPE